MLKKSAAKRQDKLIKLSDIHEELRLIEESECDYITPTGKVYKFYFDDLYYPKANYQNKANGYVYVAITSKDGKEISRRIHNLMAKAYLPNPDPIHFNVVGHKDNIKNHNELSNLYWTSNQENTQKAVDDGLNVSKVGEDNEQSMQIAVYDAVTHQLVAVYGSLSECGRKIKNTSKTAILKICKKGLYKPRGKKYIYEQCCRKFFDYHSDIQNLELEENKIEKSPTVFRMYNLELGYDEILDNQKAAEKICGIKQAQISHYLKANDGVPHNGWVFEFLENTTYKESSAFENMINTNDRIFIFNVFSNEIRVFKTVDSLNKFLNIKGHSTRDYVNTNHILQGEWRVRTLPQNSRITDGNIIYCD